MPSYGEINIGSSVYGAPIVAGNVLLSSPTAPFSPFAIAYPDKGK